MENQQNVRITRSRSKQSSTVDTSSARPILPLVKKLKKQPNAIENQDLEQNVRITRSRSKQIQAINDDQRQNNIDRLLAQMKPFAVVLDEMAVQRYYEQKKVEATSVVANELAVQRYEQKKVVAISEVAKKPTVKRKPQSKPKNRRVTLPKTLCLKPSLVQFEMIWCRVRGFPLWPGIYFIYLFSSLRSYIKIYIICRYH